MGTGALSTLLVASCLLPLREWENGVEGENSLLSLTAAARQALHISWSREHALSLWCSPMDLISRGKVSMLAVEQLSSFPVFSFLVFVFPSLNIGILLGCWVISVQDMVFIFLNMNLDMQEGFQNFIANVC